MKSQTSKTKSKKSHGGFTLIEIVVSLAIFSIVSTVALGALVNIISANKKAQALQAAVTNLNFALESISRELRVGSIYRCEVGLVDISSDAGEPSFEPQGCTYGSSDRIIAFESSRRITSGLDSPCWAVVAFKFTEGNIWKAEQEECDDTLFVASSYSPLLPTSNITITDMAVGVTDVEPVAQHLYPLTFIKLSGYVGVRENERASFDVQTAVSARIP